jgi:hypothetical protein
MIRYKYQQKGYTMYNGYANQEEFHKALQEGMAEYAKAREEGMKENPEGWLHAECDHAYGICSSPNN